MQVEVQVEVGGMQLERGMCVCGITGRRGAGREEEVWEWFCQGGSNGVARREAGVIGLIM